MGSGVTPPVITRSPSPAEPAGPPPLSGERLAAYLIGLGLTSSADVVSGQWSARPMPGRHRNFDVRSGAPGGLFVKQVTAQPSGETSHLHEARLYQWVADNPACAAARAVLPQLLFRDDALGVIILRRVPGAQTLREQIAAAGTLPSQTAARLGSALAECHRMPVIPDLPGQRAHGRGGAQGPRPWPLALAAGRTLPAHLKSSIAELRTLLAADHALLARLRQLDVSWICDCTMHGDLRWSNCLAQSDPEQIVLVDWEFAGPGDRAWDLGSVLQGFLLNAFLTPVDGMTATARVTVGARDFQRHWPAARSFWQAYLRQLRPTSGSHALLLRRALEFAGAALIQTVHELSCEAGRLSPLAPPLLSLARRLVDRPLPSGRELLGLASS